MRRALPFLKRSLIAMWWLAMPAMAAPAPAPMTQLFLVQNSGWMAPFYDDPKGRFRALVTGLAAAGAGPETPVIIAAFNKDGQVPGQHSPQLLYRGANDGNAVKGAIDGITLPRKVSGAYADSDFEAALFAGAPSLLGGKPGIIWFISNNQNAPDGAADWQARSQHFSAALIAQPHITRVYAHPVRDEVNSANFGRKEGFIIYALAYGKAAATTLDAIVASDRLRRLFGSPVARLKPIDRQTIGFRLENASVDLTQQEGYVQVTSDGGPQQLTLKGRLENRLYPFVIRSADLVVTFTPDKTQPGLAGLALAARPQHIVNVPALGRSAPVTIELALPALPQARFTDRERRAAGVVSIALKKIEYGWDHEFLGRLSAVPATDVISTTAETQLVRINLPPIFVAPLSIRTSTSDLPLQVIARYDRLWLWGTLSGLTTLLLCVWWWGGRARRKYQFLVDLDGEQHKVALSRGEKITLANSQSKRFVIQGRGESAPLVQAVTGT